MNTFNDISVAVGRQFVKLYYHTLYSEPRALYKLYNPEAIRTKASLHKDEHSESWVGIKEIKESFEKKGSGYKNVKIIGADFQPSYAGSILVTVSGTLMEDEDTAIESINFVQVFVLAAQGQSWAIQNDVLRFDAIHQKEENAKESESNEGSRNLEAVAEEVNETQENNEKEGEKEENTSNAAAVAQTESGNDANESSKEQPKSTSTESENKEENAQENTNQETNEAEAEKTEKKEEQKVKSEEEQTQKAQTASQTGAQTESTTEQAATPPQNKKPKFNKKYEQNKSSPKSKSWGQRQNSQQNNKSNPPAASPSTPAPYTPPTPHS